MAYLALDTKSTRIKTFFFIVHENKNIFMCTHVRF